MTATRTRNGDAGSYGIAIGSLLAATLFWAGNYLVGAAAVSSLDPLNLVFLRWALAVGPLLLIAHWVERPRWREVLRAWPWLIALSSLGLLGFNFLLYVALQHTDAFSASLINAFNPVLITLTSVVLLRERFTRTTFIGVVLAMVGVLTVLSDGMPLTILTVGFGTGEVLMIGAVIAWTGYTITGRLAPQLPPITATAAQAALVTVGLAPLVAFTGGPDLPSTGDALAALALIACFPSVLSYLLWNRALTVIPPARAGVFLNLIPVFTALFTVLTGLTVSAWQLGGGAVVLAGVAVANAHAFRSGQPVACGTQRRSTPGD